MDSYGEKDSLETQWEKLLAIHIYLLRKVSLGVTLVLLFTARKISNTFRFDFRGEVSDRESWKWDLKEKIPLYRARVEKVD